MDSIEMGKFICEQRKEMKLTQKELATKLHITDKAVSKWERGLSCPDIALLSQLSEILNVTTSELLNARKSGIEKIEEPSVHKALQYARITTRHRIQTLQKVSFMIFSISLILAAGICMICDYAITGQFTWSRISNSSMLLAWLVLTPLMKAPCKKIYWSLFSASVFIIPYLYLLGYFMPEYELLFPIGWQAALIAIVYVWVVYLLFHKLSAAPYLAASIAILLMVIVDLGVNLICTSLLHSAFFDFWDLLGIVVILFISIYFFIIHRRRPLR